MTHLDLNLALIAALLLAVTTITALRQRSLLVAVSIAIMITTLLVQSLPYTAHGHQGYVGFVYYPVVLYGVALKHVIYGTRAARQAVTHCLVATGVVLLSLFLLEDVHLLNTGFGARVDVMGARLVVFSLTQALLIYLLDRPWGLPTVLSVPVILVVVMIFDTIIFYPIVFFPRVPARIVAGFAITSIITKVIITMLAMPMLAVCLHLHRRRPRVLTDQAAVQAGP